MELSDNDVHRQIKHMLTFIYQEANEKVQEIDAKAEEEFNIEKGRMVQQQRLKIMEFYEKKEKQIERVKRIQFSKMFYQRRLNILQYQEDLVKQVLNETQEHLGEITNDTDRYKEILKNLILQGLYQVFETPISVRIREQDKSVVQSILPDVERTYEKATKKKVRIQIDTEKYLPEGISGGVEIFALNGRIKMNNTLESRLQDVFQKLMPQIRLALFGCNFNRKYLN